jgi:hypothetical protein
MDTIDNKYSETGSNPYYLNQNNTAKDFSFKDTTNPQTGLLDTLLKFVIVKNPATDVSFQIEEKMKNVV